MPKTGRDKQKKYLHISGLRQRWIINTIMIAAENLEQAIERSGTKAGNKGVDAAMAAIEMVNLSRAIR